MTLSCCCFCSAAGDSHPVTIGHNTNLQDGVYVGSMNPLSKPTSIGSFVSVGHGAVLQGCTVADKTLIGMNAVLQEGATVRGGGEGCWVWGGLGCWEWGAWCLSWRGWPAALVEFSVRGKILWCGQWSSAAGGSHGERGEGCWVRSWSGS